MKNVTITLTEEEADVLLGMCWKQKSKSLASIPFTEEEMLDVDTIKEQVTQALQQGRQG